MPLSIGNHQQWYTVKVPSHPLRQSVAQRRHDHAANGAACAALVVGGWDQDANRGKLCGLATRPDCVRAHVRQHDGVPQPAVATDRQTPGKRREPGLGARCPAGQRDLSHGFRRSAGFLHELQTQVILLSMPGASPLSPFPGRPARYTPTNLSLRQELSVEARRLVNHGSVWFGASTGGPTVVASRMLSALACSLIRTAAVLMASMASKT